MYNNDDDVLHGCVAHLVFMLMLLKYAFWN